MEIAEQYYADYLLTKIKETVSYDEQIGLLRIPNNTSYMKEYCDFYTYKNLNYSESHYWAEEIAIVALQKYEEETGESYFEQTGIPVAKVAFEIRIHEQCYMAGLFTTRTDITDVSPNLGNGWSRFLQSAIDAMYSMGLR